MSYVQNTEMHFLVFFTLYMTLTRDILRSHNNIGQRDFKLDHSIHIAFSICITSNQFSTNIPLSAKRWQDYKATRSIVTTQYCEAAK